MPPLSILPAQVCLAKAALQHQRMLAPARAGASTPWLKKNINTNPQTASIGHFTKLGSCLQLFQFRTQQYHFDTPTEFIFKSHSFNFNQHHVYTECLNWVNKPNENLGSIITCTALGNMPMPCSTEPPADDKIKMQGKRTSCMNST